MIHDETGNTISTYGADNKCKQRFNWKMKDNTEMGLR